MHVRCGVSLARVAGRVRADIVCLILPGEQNPPIPRKIGTMREHGREGGPQGSVCRQPAWSIRDVGRRTKRQPVSRSGATPTSGRIRSAWPARTCPNASAIITASASPIRAFILARPRM